MIQECRSSEDLRRLLAESEKRPVFLLKHSSRCPISAAAWREYQDFERTHPGVEATREAEEAEGELCDCWRVLVLENKALSAQIAQETGVSHQSPQALLIYKGQVVWHKSHWDITQEAMQAALDEAMGGRWSKIPRL